MSKSWDNEIPSKFLFLAYNFFFGPQSLKFIEDLGWRLKTATDEANSKQYLLQRISVPIQRGDTDCVSGTLGQQEGLFYPPSLFLYLFINIFVVVLFLYYNLILFKICKVMCSVCSALCFLCFFGCFLCFSVILFLSPVLVCVVLPALVSTFFSLCLVFIFCFVLFSFGNNKRIRRRIYPLLF